MSKLLSSDEAPDQPAPGSATHEVGHTVEPHLLTRLNARGFRLVQAADAFVLLAIMLATALVRYGWDWPSPDGTPDYPKGWYLLSFAVTLVIFMAALYFGGLYEREPRLGTPPVLPRVARQTLAAAGIVALLNLSVTGIVNALGEDTPRALPLPIANLVVLLVVGAVAVTANRHVSSWLRTRREGPPAILLVGSDKEVALAEEHLGDDRDVQVVGDAVDVDGLVDRAREVGATDVVLLSSRWLDEIYPDVLRTLEANEVSVLQRVTGKETMFGLERVREIGGMPFVLLRPHTIPTSRLRFKRFTDVAMLLALSPVLVPLLGLVAVYELFVVGRPILFWQERVGVGGRHFRMVKFRTMVERAEEDGSPQLATRNDPRIVPACRWLRATRLDELPQIWNILRGDMSLVGPRPERPELTAEFEQVIPGYGRRHEVPPGLTGLAQIHGRYHTDPEYKLGHDLQYLVNWSPVLDLEILVRTAWVVLTRRI